MSAYGTKRPVDGAPQESAVESKRRFAVRVKASLMKLIADIVGDTEDAAGPLLCQRSKPSKNRTQVRDFSRFRSYLAA
jgi:hypothetical protein